MDNFVGRNWDSISIYFSLSYSLISLDFYNPTVRKAFIIALFFKDNHPVSVADNQWHTLILSRVDLDTGI